VTKKTINGAVIFKTILFTLLHNISRLLKTNSHNVNNRSAEINFNLKNVKCVPCPKLPWSNILLNMKYCKILLHYRKSLWSQILTIHISEGWSHCKTEQQVTCLKIFLQYPSYSFIPVAPTWSTGHPNSFHLINLKQSVGLLWWGSSPSQGCYLT
jgi:hypothetical protein